MTWNKPELARRTKDFLEQYFLCQFPLNFLDYNNILISMKKDAEDISVNTVRTTFLLHKLMVLHT